ncbi:hypothetical protein GCM10020000_19230 [Streptomyces olivoverticillatus]
MGELTESEDARFARFCHPVQSRGAAKVQGEDGRRQLVAQQSRRRPCVAPPRGAAAVGEAGEGADAGQGERGQGCSVVQGMRAAKYTGGEGGQGGSGFGREFPEHLRGVGSQRASGFGSTGKAPYKAFGTWLGGPVGEAGPVAAQRLERLIRLLPSAGLVPARLAERNDGACQGFDSCGEAVGADAGAAQDAVDGVEPDGQRPAGARHAAQQEFGRRALSFGGGRPARRVR